MSQAPSAKHYVYFFGSRPKQNRQLESVLSIYTRRCDILKTHFSKFILLHKQFINHAIIVHIVQIANEYIIIESNQLSENEYCERSI